MKNTILKELLQQEPQALSVLHNAELYDFTKDFTILKHDGRFTVAALEKEAAAAGHTADDSIIMCYTTGRKWDPDKLYMYKLTGAGKFEVEYKICKYTTGRAYCKVDDFYAKTQLNDTRKQDGLTTYIICQKKENQATENPHPVDLAARFTLKKFDTYRKSSGGQYIDRVYLRRTDDTGSAYTYHDRSNIIYESRFTYTAIDEIIDKSGYIVDRKRDELKRRAAGLKADRAKAAYLETDNENIIKELENLFTETKNAIIEELKQATTAEELKKVNKKLDYWRGLAGIAGDLERLKERDAAREYSSISKFTAAADEIRAALEKLTAPEEGKEEKTA